MISIAYPYIPRNAIAEVTDTLKSRWIGQGPKVKRFEELFETTFEVANAVAVNSGTAALELAYDLLELGPGDEVITTPLTCTATNIPLVRRRVTIVFADIRRDTLNIDPSDIERKISPRTKAIVNVHLHGVESVLPDFGVPVISDSAQALGIFSGRFTCCSFQAIKHLTTGDGGMLVCQEAADAKKARLWRWFGIDREATKDSAGNWKGSRWDCTIPEAGFKFHMNNIEAAIGLEGLRDLRANVSQRQKNYRFFLKALAPYAADLQLPILEKREACACMMFPIVIHPESKVRRAELIEFLEAHGIETRYAMPLLSQPVYRKLFPGYEKRYPVARWMDANGFYIGCHQYLSGKDLEHVAAIFRAFFERKESK